MLAGVVVTPTISINVYPGLEAVFPWMRHISFTRSLKPVEVALATPEGPVGFLVPKAYLKWIPNQKGGTQPFINLMIDRRDMRPATLGGGAYVDAEGRVHPEPPPPAQEDILHVRLKTTQGSTFISSHWIPHLLETRLVLDAELGNHIRRFHTKSRVPQGTLPHRDADYYVIYEDKAPAKLIRCLPPEPPLNVGCRLSVDLMPYVYAEIAFRRTRFADWRSIEAEVQTFVDGLRLQPAAQSYPGAIGGG